MNGSWIITTGTGTGSSNDSNTVLPVRYAKTDIKTGYISAFLRSSAMVCWDVLLFFKT